MTEKNNSDALGSQEQFPAGVAEQVGAYVYALRDPQSKKIFYIGKGTGNRVFAHANGVLDEDGVSLKNDLIREILRNGYRVEAFLIQHGLGDHKNSEKSHAHQTESALFGLLSLLDPALDNGQFSLSNLVAPPSFGNQGLRSISDVIAQYGQPADVALIPHNSIFIKPTKTWRLGMPDDELYENTRGWWEMNLGRASGIRYVFSIPKFIIRAIYQVDDGGWRERQATDRDAEDDDGKKPRVGFVGTDVSASFPHLINRSVEHVYGPGQAKRKDWKYLDDVMVKDLSKKGKNPWWNFS